MTIRELEELIKAAPNKNLPVHIECFVEGTRCTILEANLEDNQLLLIEKDEEVDSEFYNKDEDNEDEDEDEVEDE